MTLLLLPTWALALLVAAASIVVYGYHPILRRRYSHLPGPKPLWFRGNVDEVIKRNIYGAYDFWEKRHGKVFRVFLGSRPVVACTYGPSAKKVMLRQPTRPPLGGPAEIPISRDNRFIKHDLLTTQNPSYHRSLKRTGWLPAFRGASIALSSKCMDAGARELVARLGKVADNAAAASASASSAGEKKTTSNNEVNIWRMMGEVTLDVVFRAAFGIELGTQKDPAERSERASRLIDAARSIFEVGQRNTRYFRLGQAFPPAKPLLRAVATVLPDAPLRQVHEARAHVFRTVEELIKEKRAQRAASAAGGGVSSSSPSPSPSSSSAPVPPPRPPSAVAVGCFIDSLLDARHDDGTCWAVDEVVQACMTFALAAYETTATTIAFVVYGLCLNDDARAAIAAQLDANPLPEGKDGDELPADFLETFAERYPAIDAAMAEALRLWPPGVITIRKAATDDDGKGNAEIWGFEEGEEEEEKAAARGGAGVNVSGDSGGITSSLSSSPSPSPSSSLLSPPLRRHRPKRYLVPKGTWIHCCIWSIHRDASVWPRADEFLPGRFLAPPPPPPSPSTPEDKEGAQGEKEKGSEPPSPLSLYEQCREARLHYYFPFGDGALSCVGRRFAEAEARIVLARLYSELEFELSPGQVPLKLRAPLTLGPLEGIFVAPRRRSEKKIRPLSPSSSARPKTPGTPPQ